MGRLTRRETLRLMAGAGAAGAGWLMLPSRGRWGPAASHAAAPEGVSFDPAPFTLGVASGDPTPDSVLLWTRVAPEPLLGHGGMTRDVPVRWVVARDPGLRDPVASGTAMATSAFGHSLHIDVGGLRPGTTYYYAFSTEGTTSRIGRTRTAPPAGTDHLRFCFASCQRFEAGYYAAYRHLAAEDIDVVVHLGDYIYEKDVQGIRRHHGGVAETLEDYRIRHAVYKGDPDLRMAHAAHPWVVTWDDHEIRNNYAPGGEPDSFDPRQAAGYQAYYEHLPVRGPDGPPRGTDFRIYRDLSFGGLVDLIMLDGRQYRDDQPCDDAELVTCAEASDPERTMLGDAQMAWLRDRLANSDAAWKVLGNQVGLAPFKIGGTPEATEPVFNAADLVDGVYINGDSWSGYQAERNALLRHIHEQGIEDLIVITGDAHRHFVNDLKVDFDDPLSPIVATEFIGTSVTTRTGDDTDEGRRLIYPNNNHTRYFEGEERGYAVCDVTTDRWHTEFKIVVPDVNDPLADITTLAEFEVRRGNPVVQQVAGDGGNPVPRLTP